METRNIKIPLKVGKISVKIISFMDNFNLLGDPELFINNVCNEMDSLNEKDHYGGFANKKDFSQSLKHSLFKDDQTGEYAPDIISSDEILTETIYSIKLLDNLVTSKEILIYIFPIDSKWVIEKLDGIWGQLVWDDIIHLYINPTKNWKLNFRSTIIHEMAHNLQKYVSYDMTLFENLIADGLAEHLQKDLLNGNRNSFTEAISKEESFRIFEELKGDLGKTLDKEPKLFSDLFFGGGKYKSGTGYTIGYYLVEKYFKTLDKINWKEILRNNPKKEYDYTGVLFS